MTVIVSTILSLLVGKILTFRLSVHDAANRMADRHKLRPRAAAELEGKLLPRLTNLLLIGAVCAEVAVFASLCHGDCVWSATHQAILVLLAALCAHRYLGPRRSSGFWLKVLRTSLDRRSRKAGNDRSAQLVQSWRKLLQQFDEAMPAR